MIVTGVNPHRFGFAGAFEAAFSVEIQGLGIGHNDVLVKVSVAGDEHFHDLFSNSAMAIFGKDKEMRIVNHEMAVGNGIAEADQSRSIPGGD